MMNAEFLAKHRAFLDKYVDVLSNPSGNPTMYLEGLTDRELYIMAHFMQMIQTMIVGTSMEVMRISKARGTENDYIPPEML